MSLSDIRAIGLLPHLLTIEFGIHEDVFQISCCRWFSSFLSWLGKQERERERRKERTKEWRAGQWGSFPAPVHSLTQKFTWFARRNKYEKQERKKGGRASGIAIRAYLGGGCGWKWTRMVMMWWWCW